ncbi:hypothetical protein GW17_00043768 [Ensete ventricosum]|nr:hypothetical protein GW17_00043768 [Ensete ventricosum]
MSTTETGCSSTEPEVTGGLGYDETELTLSLPGAGGSRPSETDRKRGFAETVGLNLGAASRGEDCGARSSDSSDGPVSSALKLSAAKSMTCVFTFFTSEQGPGGGVAAGELWRRCSLASPSVRLLILASPTHPSGFPAPSDRIMVWFCWPTVAGYYPDERRLVDPVNGTEYVPTYEDKDGDWMLVGDVPWKSVLPSFLSYCCYSAN